MKAIPLFFALALTWCSVRATAQQPSAPPPNTAAAATQSTVRLSAGAQEVARLTGLSDLIDRYFQLPPEERRYGKTMSAEAMMLRLQITETILSASLDADGVMGEIDSEIETLLDARTFLEARRDRALNINTIAGIVAGGAGGVIATALQFKESTASPGNVIGVAGGAVSTFLSVIGLRQQRGGAREFTDAPNMLAPFFDRPGEFDVRYPAAIWQYLNSPAPAEPQKGTRRERLRKDWIAEGRLEEKDSPKAKAKIVFLTSGSSQHLKLTIDLLNDREAMLTDVRLWVELMKRDLSKLLQAVRTQ